MQMYAFEDPLPLYTSANRNKHPYPILILTYFVLPNEMKRISSGPSTTFKFIVLLIEKQYINLINSSIYINFWCPVHIVWKTLSDKAENRSTWGKKVKITSPQKSKNNLKEYQGAIFGVGNRMTKEFHRKVVKKNIFLRISSHANRSTPTELFFNISVLKIFGKKYYWLSAC